MSFKLMSKEQRETILAFCHRHCWGRNAVYAGEHILNLADDGAFRTTSDLLAWAGY